jgi:hypothetical protein
MDKLKDAMANFLDANTSLMLVSFLDGSLDKFNLKFEKQFPFYTLVFNGDGFYVHNVVTEVSFLMITLEDWNSSQ